MARERRGQGMIVRNNAVVLAAARDVAVACHAQPHKVALVGMACAARPVPHMLIAPHRISLYMISSRMNRLPCSEGKKHRKHGGMNNNHHSFLCNRALAENTQNDLKPHLAPQQS